MLSFVEMFPNSINLDYDTSVPLKNMMTVFLNMKSMKIMEPINWNFIKELCDILRMVVFSIVLQRK